MKVGYIGSVIGIKHGETTKKEPRKKAFTLQYNPDDPRLYSPARITIGGKTIETENALWDTGATIIAISHKTAGKFDEKPAEIGTGISATDKVDSAIYRGTVELPGGIVFHDVDIWDIDLSAHGADVVIGMDIISRGKLVVETVNGIPTFSFSVNT